MSRLSSRIIDAFALCFPKTECSSRLRRFTSPWKVRVHRRRGNDVAVFFGDPTDDDNDDGGSQPCGTRAAGLTIPARCRVTYISPCIHCVPPTTVSIPRCTPLVVTHFHPRQRRRLFHSLSPSLNLSIFASLFLSYPLPPPPPLSFSLLPLSSRVHLVGSFPPFSPDDALFVFSFDLCAAKL